MKLYYSPGACSLAPHILLRETNLPFELERVNTGTHQFGSGADYYSINPKGQVPVLELEDGARLSEGPVIAQYISEQAGRTDLLPAPGSRDRYRVLEWQNYITSELHKSYTPLFGYGLSDEANAVFRRVLRKKYEWVNEQLNGKLYLTGDDFSAADAYLFTVTNWARHVGLDLSDLSHLQNFQDRVAARPAVREAMQAEGLKTAVAA